jgi:hypothetical protein
VEIETFAKTVKAEDRAAVSKSVSKTPAARGAEGSDLGQVFTFGFELREELLIAGPPTG